MVSLQEVADQRAPVLTKTQKIRQRGNAFSHTLAIFIKKRERGTILRNTIDKEWMIFCRSEARHNSSVTLAWTSQLKICLSSATFHAVRRSMPTQYWLYVPVRAVICPVRTGKAADWWSCRLMLRAQRTQNEIITLYVVDWPLEFH